MNKKDLYLLDGSGYIFRAYYALPPLTRPDGLPTGAIFGFCQMLLNVIDKKPTNIAVVFDSARDNFRHDIYPQYKHNRGETPEDLIPQFPYFRAAATALSLPIIEAAGFEADDVIATLATQAAKQGFEVKIYSSDKDLMQLIGDGISLIDPFKNKAIDEAAVKEKFGVTPALVADVQALMGDSSDGFPGLPGIGPKTAANLINEFGNLDNLLQQVDKIKNARQQEIVKTHVAEAKIFYQLARLRQDTPLSLSLDKLAAPLNPNLDQQLTAIKFFEELEFKKLAKKWRDKFNLPDDNPPPADTAKKDNGHAAAKPAKATTDHTKKTAPSKLPSKTPADMVITMLDEKNITALVDAVEQFGRLAFIIAGDYLVMGLENGQAFVTALAPRHHNAMDDTKNNLFATDTPPTLPQGLQEIFASDAIKKYSPEVASDIITLEQQGLARVDNLSDVSVLHFCLFAGAKNEDMDECNQEYYEKIIKENNKNKDAASQASTAPQAASQELLAELSCVAYRLLRLGIFYEQTLVADKLSRIYYQIEQPLLPILAAIEKNGVAIDMEKFAMLGKQTDQAIADLQKKIFASLGQEFNLGSPKQLGDVLFAQKKIGGDKIAKTKTGQFSTSSDVLESLVDDHPVVADILQHRHLEKLNNTYIRALPLLARRDAAGQPRLHSHFSSTNAQTGRLSSLNPNLQNIPIRTEQGAALRECFIAPPRKLLLSLDYSQIELRILALLSGAPALKKAFLAGDDIHRSTASEIFETPMDKVTPELRRRAKAVNFGIIYGISAFGLARQLQIPQSDAKNIIARYFEKLPGVKEFMDRVIASTEKNGFVETLFGRRIYLPAIFTKGPAKAYAIRQAMNAPLQGTAADLIKRAMIKIDHYLLDHGLSQDCQMILQVHDELLFEVAEEAVETITPALKKIMAEVTLFGFHREQWQGRLGNGAGDGIFAGIDWHDQEHDFLFFPVENGVGKNWRLAH